MHKILEPWKLSSRSPRPGPHLRLRECRYRDADNETGVSATALEIGAYLCVLFHPHLDIAILDQVVSLVQPPL
jgi:hypothetical protein